jgi:hippurate hydrolase
MLNGTVRTLTPRCRTSSRRPCAPVIEATAAAHDAVAELTYTRGYPATVNHAEQARLARGSRRAWLGEGKVRRDMPPVMGGEDFSFMLLEKPGAYIKFGRAPAPRAARRCTRCQYDFQRRPAADRRQLLRRHGGAGAEAGLRPEAGRPSPQDG